MAVRSSGSDRQLRIAHPWPRERMRGIDRLIDEFRALHQVAVELVPIPAEEWDEYHSKILADMAAGRAPDLAYIVTESLELFGARLAEPLDDMVLRDRCELRDYFSDVHPLLVESMMYEGSLFALPVEFNAANMFYNRALFGEAGLSRPAEDWTKHDFYEVVRSLGAAAHKERVTSYAWVNRLWGGLMPWIYVTGSNLLQEERVNGGLWLWPEFYPGSAVQSHGGWRWGAPQANDPRNCEALQFLVDLTGDGLVPQAKPGGGSTLLAEFASQRLAMTPAGGFWAGWLHDAGMPSDAYDVQFFPRWITQRHQFGAAGYVITKQARDPDLAWEWVKFSASRRSMETALEANQTTPARRSMASADRYAMTGPRHWEVFYDTLDRFPDSAPVPAPIMSTPVTSVLTKYVGLAISGQLSAKQAMDRLQLSLERVGSSQ